jgi:uncharacterized protein YjbI with pentapeptide repeats
VSEGANRAKWLFQDDPAFKWKPYRCWVADFRDADLTNADFTGAGLTGADFRSATLTGAKFERAEISRANFMYAKGLIPDQLKDTCADDQPLLPFKLEIKPCKRL